MRVAVLLALDPTDPLDRLALPLLDLRDQLGEHVLECGELGGELAATPDAVARDGEGHEPTELVILSFDMGISAATS